MIYSTQQKHLSQNINIYLLMICRTIFVLTILVLAFTAPNEERMPFVPGYPNDNKTTVYTGYLDLKSTTREAHYVFVESLKGPRNNDPLTLWLNGGPGCSSLIGFIQQIGPYYLQEGKNYKKGDNLTQNPHSWHKASNLLFLQSPAGVGYSYNTDPTYVLNDHNTAIDNFNALLDFLRKFPQYKNSPLWLAGESYAGKYIPDLAQLIDIYNVDAASPLNLKGILVGNGIMSFDTLSNSQVNYMMDRSFVNPEIKQYWDNACQFDPDSAGCRYFAIKFQQDIDQINVYDVYNYCYYNDSFVEPNSEEVDGEEVKQIPKRKRYLSQESILQGIKRKFSNSSAFQNVKYNNAPCAYFDGMFDYFNLNEIQYRAKFPNQKWNGPCAQNITYTIDQKGSMSAYGFLLGRIHQTGYQIHLYNGNWDVVVPYHDTVQNIRRLNLQESYLYIPWFTGDQHSGFQQLYSGLVFTIFKGASHQVPQSKRAEAFNMFNSTLDGNKDMFKHPKQK